MTYSDPCEIERAIRAVLNNGHRSISVVKTDDGRWQANLRNHDGSYRVEISDDATDAVWRVCVPFHARRLPLP